MKVKLKQTMASPFVIVKAGEVAEFPDALALKLVSDGFAEHVEALAKAVVEKLEVKAEDETQTADASVGETSDAPPVQGVVIADAPPVEETAEAPIVSEHLDAKKKGKKS